MSNINKRILHELVEPIMAVKDNKTQIRKASETLKKAITKLIEGIDNKLKKAVPNSEIYNDYQHIKQLYFKCLLLTLVSVGVALVFLPYGLIPLIVVILVRKHLRHKVKLLCAKVDEGYNKKCEYKVYIQYYQHLLTEIKKQKSEIDKIKDKKLKEKFKKRYDKLVSEYEDKIAHYKTLLIEEEAKGKK